MTDKMEKDEAEKTQENQVADQINIRGKGNKTIMMIGIVVLISVGCAFVFVSKVYPALTRNIQPVAGEQKKEGTNEVPEVQTTKLVETEKEPVSIEKKKEEKGKEDKKNAEEESMIMPVDPVIVNLSGSGGRRYLKAKVNLEARDGNVKKKIETKLVQIKDRLISILSSKTLEDIEGLEGQENLRKEIKDTVDIILKMNGGVVQVYFTEFVVQ